MIYKQTTQVPNILFDRYLPLLTESELKILLIIIRQTYGWVDKRTKRRKTKDRISHNQFIQKTGLSRRVISKTLKSLLTKRYINICDQYGQALSESKDRKGRSHIFYSFQPDYVAQMVRPHRANAMKQIGEILESAKFRYLKSEVVTN